MCIFKVNKKLMLAEAKKILFLIQERMEFWSHLLHTVSSSIKLWLKIFFFKLAIPIDTSFLKMHF